MVKNENKEIKLHIRIIILGISAFGFLDLLINHTPNGLFNSDLNLLTSFLSFLGLIILILKHLFKKKLKVSKKILNSIRITLILLFLGYLKVLLMLFNFIQFTEYIVVILLTLPIIFFIRDLFTEKIKSKHFLILGFTLLFPTLIYFNFIYKPYEAYSDNGIPIIFIHQNIRNWICYIGIVFILTSLVKVNNPEVIRVKN
ncbi:hypothetical protein PG911_05305 [Tenacibaculum ovolyticum]|uniref:hypothetical protein n=1 Tax=Tenacibaculum ovolyticum TaxID=104270 RepID=UPI0022F3D0AA|nr:hypothetical protein [Tenacibaculum ovolyticum]WBX77676.1 hypothetical protein PG911_05305 [Tenacibaculum ovolyticum]